MRLKLKLYHLYFSFLKTYRSDSSVLRKKAKAQFTLLSIFLLSGFTFIILDLIFLGMNTDVLMVIIALSPLIIGFVLLYRGSYNSSVFFLLVGIVLLMPLTAFISSNHEPIKLYNVAIFGIIALLVAGLTAERVIHNILVGIASFITLTVYFLFFVIPAELKPFTLMIDAYIASMVLVGLSTFISIFLTLQLNQLIYELLRSNSELDRRVAERTRQLKISRNRLIETEKLSALGGMIAGISHEINTPLGSSILINSHFGTIRDDLQEMVIAGSVTNTYLLEFLEKSDDLRKLQEDSLSRLKKLIDSFRKISADNRQKEPELVNIREEIEMTLRIFRKKIQSTPGVNLKIENPREMSIVTYPNLLWQVLTHLLENSLFHAFPSGVGSIELSYEMVDSNLVLQYRDDGIGMDRESQKRIFEPFFTTDRGKGRTGLGMIMVYNLLKNAGGDIQVNSLPGDGLSYSVRLPDLSRENEQE
ncbi:MAG: hypothetical protein DRP60_10475 [Spirochaetes bacterium]|nr:MAG: hypothetical protein DRP60_10475 [Spirochaetota bacterium]